MNHAIDAHIKRTQTTEELQLCFDKDFFAKSKYLLFAMGFASLYCLGYGLVLFYEFKKMGVLQAIVEKL
jgi:hypothetical protein